MEPSEIAAKCVPKQTTEWVMRLLNLSAATPETKAAVKEGLVSPTTVSREVAHSGPDEAEKTVNAAISTVKAKGAKKASQREVEAHRNGSVAPKAAKVPKVNKGSDIDKGLALLAVMRAAWTPEAVTVNDDETVTVVYSKADGLAITDLLEVE
jgi:hypothetical protein